MEVEEEEEKERECVPGTLRGNMLEKEKDADPFGTNEEWGERRVKHYRESSVGRIPWRRAPPVAPPPSPPTPG